MNRLSIKTRVALWYAFSMLAVLVVVAALLLAAGDKLILEETRRNLTEVTDRAVRDIRIRDGKLAIDDDISYYSDGAYVVVCREDGTLISGLIPDGFPEDTGFMADVVRRISSGEYSCYVYDRLIENQASGKIWVRGVSSARLRDMAPSVMMMIRGFIIVLPLIFLAALAGGWILTRQAFAPLNQIVNTAEQIRQGGELSRRIGLGGAGGPDEVRRTAAVFDEMLDQLEKDFEAEKRFTNDASHELRTPVAVVLAESEYALDNLDDRGEVRESLEEIHTQAQNMSTLISRLLTLARADRGIEQLKKEAADLSLLAEESAGRLASEASARGIRLQVEAEEGCYMECDPVFIGRMFDNLIDNSIKYGRAGGRTLIRVQKLPGTDEGAEPCSRSGLAPGAAFPAGGESAGGRGSGDGCLRVEIADDGIGIAEEHLPRIWERFYQVQQDGARGDQSGSMGLGLPLVRWIVEEHGGRICVRSRPGEGTQFNIVFPGYRPE